MSNILTMAKQEIREIVAPMKFHSYREYYYRVVNGVVQTFNILTRHGDCTCHFGILPLSHVKMRQWDGDFNLNLIDTKLNSNLGQRYRPGLAEELRSLLAYYDRNDPDTFLPAARKFKIRLEDYLLPLFRNTETPETAYESLRSLSLKRYFDADESTDFIIHFLLMMHRYEEASKQLQAAIACGEESIRTIWEGYSDQELAQKNIKDIKFHLTRYNELLDKTEERDAEWLDNWLLDLQRQGLCILKLKEKDVIRSV